MSDREFGVVVHWNVGGGYGFVGPIGSGREKGERVRDRFVHVSDLSEEPRIGDRCTYEVGVDRNGRPCAKQVCFVSSDDQEDTQEERAIAEAAFEREDRAEATALAAALLRAGFKKESPDAGA